MNKNPNNNNNRQKSNRRADLLCKKLRKPELLDEVFYSEILNNGRLGIGLL
jgi:hypothetical protein